MSKTSTKTASSQTASSVAAGQVPADGNTQKDPKTWVTGGEPMTGAQRSYLNTLGQETGVEIPPDLTKGEASEKINELKKIDPRTSGSM